MLRTGMYILGGLQLLLIFGIWSATQLHPNPLLQVASRATPKKVNVLFVAHSNASWTFVREIQAMLAGSPEFEVTQRTCIPASYDSVALPQGLDSQVLERTDVVWVEWAHRCAAWMSRHLAPEKHLIIRLHRFEMTQPHIFEVVWERVDDLIFIAEHVRDQTQALIGRSLAVNSVPKTHVILNYESTAGFNLPKYSHAKYSLGLLGWAGWNKNAYLAVEILLLLRQSSTADWRLYLGGDNASSKGIIDAKKPDPLEVVYEKQLQSLLLRAGKSVVLTGHARPEEFFRNVQYVLSTSFIEGSHQALTQGMLSGAIPVVKHRYGVHTYYNGTLVFHTAAQAAAIIRNISDSSQAERIGYATPHELFPIDASTEDSFNLMPEIASKRAAFCRLIGK